MTNRLAGFTVTLEHDIREDDAGRIIDAIRCLRGVLSVDPVVAGVELHIAEERARRELGGKLWAVLYPVKEPKVT
jgi:hypothetical protein